MKKYLFIATALAALASCSSDEFVGENTSPTTSNAPGAIQFTSDAGKMTRATSNTGSVAEMLGGQMKIFGVKKKNATTDPVAAAVYTTVFNNYQLWSSATATTSNYDTDWEYVGAAGTHGSYVNSSSQTVSPTVTIVEGKDQYIKYWDWSTDEYHFVAGSPVSSFTYTTATTGDNIGEIVSATVSGINGHINPNSSTPLSKEPVYIAAPVKKVNGTDYNTDVEFVFTRQQSYVRVGVYEIIPGYKISSISFYEWDCDKTGGADWKDEPQAAHNIVLNSMTEKYFKGGAASATVTYDWDTPSYSFVFASAGAEQENWYGGLLNLSETNPLATSSTEGTTTYFYGTDADIDSKGYFTVLPTPSGTTAQPIIIKCDYTLKALDTDDEIKVSGATAAIPAAFSYWNPNTSYTYLFKISDNTNGKTGPNQPNEGLYPITFDAVVTTVAAGTSQGTTTTVSTPSITTYQEGSVTDEGIEYKTGTAITATITTPNRTTIGGTSYDAGAVLPINTIDNTVGCVKVYYLGTTAKTEADLQLVAPTTGSQTVSVTSYVLSFTPATNDIEGTAGTAIGYYAIQYLTATGSPNAYTYKVIAVKKAE
ncbi:MAG: membrane lipoprotein lipid attachment site-containing protein [Prevotella sp.]|nr:membrane lipoprotein lipid attachment site-containing protein [Prevotella sp.]